MTSAPQVTQLPVDDAPQAALAFVALLRRSLASRIRTAAKKNSNVISTVATSFGVFLIFAVQGIFMARLLGPEKRAEYGTAVLYTQTFTYIGLLGTLLAIAGHAARNTEGLRNLRRSAIRLGAITGVGTALVVVVLSLIALPAAKAFLAPLCMICALMLPFDHIRLALLSVDHGAGAFPKYNRNLLVNAAVLPLLLCILWMAGIRSIGTVLAATLLIPLVALAYRFASEGFGIIGNKVEPPIRSLLVEGIPYAAAQTSHDLFNRLDAVLILWLASLTEQGYYTAAVSTAALMVVAPNALALFSFRASAAAGPPPTLGRTVAAGIAVLTIQLVTLGAFLAVLEPLIILVFGPAFRGAVPYAKVLLPAHAISGLTYVAGGYLRGRRKPLVEVWSRVLGTAVMVTAALALRSTWHDLGVPIAAVCGHTTCAVILCWAVLADTHRRRLLARGPAEAPVT
ncbi:MAG TPA: oligosaccharide flippase family protein [Planctomycetaceae bacterium]|jgi:O-antigen/teichoic acid export membrane protein|nr:oligosaccharide flippase family protein [Planctomycetaceae bacterium]